MKWAGHDSINENTGLTYMQARWMDNNTGRFISMDPIKDGFNWYAYCAGNPVSYTDPTGLEYKHGELIGEKDGSKYYYHRVHGKVRVFSNGDTYKHDNRSTSGSKWKEIGRIDFSDTSEFPQGTDSEISDDAASSEDGEGNVTWSTSTGSGLDENDEVNIGEGLGEALGLDGKSEQELQEIAEGILAETPYGVNPDSRDGVDTGNGMIEEGHSEGGGGSTNLVVELTPEEQAKKNNRSQWTGENGELDWEKILKKVLIGAWEEALDDYKNVLGMFIVPGLSVANTINTVVELITNIQKDPDYLTKLKESLLLELKMKVDGIGDLLTGDFYGFTENYTPEEGGASLYRLAQAIVSAKAAKKLGPKFKSKCFIAGTLVLTAVGNIPIEEIKVGDFVYAKNVQTGEKGLKEVVETYVNTIDAIYHLYTENEHIQTTTEHPFWVVGKGFVESNELREVELFELHDGSTVKLIRVEVEHLEQPVKVYNFQVADWSTYYVGLDSVLVHNRSAKVSGRRGSVSFKHTWIKHDTYNKMVNEIGPKKAEQFIKAMNKGPVGPKGQNGIKMIRGKGISYKGSYYKYELKVLGKGTSHYRALGNITEDGTIIFSVFDNL